ncbi:hypothetical protein ABVT39_019043 [Epinephelus coioides]
MEKEVKSSYLLSEFWYRSDGYAFLPFLDGADACSENVKCSKCWRQFEPEPSTLLRATFSDCGIDGGMRGHQSDWLVTVSEFEKFVVWSLQPQMFLAE